LAGIPKIRLQFCKDFSRVNSGPFSALYLSILTGFSARADPAMIAPALLREILIGGSGRFGLFFGMLYSRPRYSANEPL
jgi:hypothetical protein